MAEKKIIAIIGATGNQGGGLMRAILKEGEESDFIARAITRDASSEKAEALRNMGVEVVEADISNEASLVEAIQGCYGMFCVTVMNPTEPETEIEQARIMANAARTVGIKHVIWSTLEDSRILAPLDSETMPTIMGKFKVPHFDVKGEADALFADLPTTYLLTSFYWENFTTFFAPKKGPDGKYYLNFPMGKKHLPSISVEDIGKCALGIFKRPHYINKRIGIAGDKLRVAVIAEKMSQVLGQEIVYNSMSFDDFRKLPFPAAVGIGNMLQYHHDFEHEYAKARGRRETRKLNPELLTFDEWLVQNKDNFHLE